MGVRIRIKNAGNKQSFRCAERPPIVEERLPGFQCSQGVPGQRLRVPLEKIRQQSVVAWLNRLEFETQERMLTHHRLP
jgi:hypothetical protein